MLTAHEEGNEIYELDEDEQFTSNRRVIHRKLYKHFFFLFFVFKNDVISFIRPPEQLRKNLHGLIRFFSFHFNLKRRRIRNRKETESSTSFFFFFFQLGYKLYGNKLYFDGVIRLPVE